MTTVQISLPDELVQQATNAGLLAPEAMENLLREELRRRAGESLRQMWERAPGEELSPSTEEEIAEAVRQVRAEKRRRGAS